MFFRQLRVEAHKISQLIVRQWPFIYNVHTDLADEVYGAMYDQLDEVAELILMNDGSPLGSFLANATLFRGCRDSRIHRRFTGHSC